MSSTAKMLLLTCSVWAVTSLPTNAYRNSSYIIVSEYDLYSGHQCGVAGRLWRPHKPIRRNDLQV